MVLGLVFGLLWFLPGGFYWLKWAFSYVALWVWKRTHRGRFDLYDYEVDNQPEKCGFLVPKEERILETPCSDEHLQKAADEVFVYGVNNKSESVAVWLSRASDGKAEAWISIVLADGLRYQLLETGYQHGDSAAFTCGGLQMHYLSPMRRWRISFCGMMREEEGNQKETFVKFNLIWTASSEVYDFSSHLLIQPTAEAMAKAEWKSFFPPINTLVGAIDIYCQSGVLTGIVTVEDKPEVELYLFGERVRNLGQSSLVAGSKFKQVMGVVPESGLIIHLTKVSVPNAVQNLYFGFIVHPIGNIIAIEDGLIITKFSETDTSKRLTAMFKAGKMYELIGGFSNDRVCMKSEYGWSGSVEMHNIEFSVKGLKGSGLLMSGEVTGVPRRTVRNIPPVFPSAKPLTVYFTDDISYLSDLTGGKGSSLGRLTELSRKMQSFVVPKGIIVTTQAYSEFLTVDVVHRIEDLKNVVYGNVQGDVKEVSKIVVSAIERSSLPDKIAKDIEEKLNSLFDGRINHHLFAVRSSATGEDTEQMSAAGQMDTFLGVQGLKEIFTAAKKCWASQFSPIAIEYKRQNGQILNSPMAVVIQEMVRCDAAGVLFTCDPVTNNPSVVAITGNYGLGETVVSGSEEPDTIVLQKLDNNEVELKSVTIGQKAHKIVVREAEVVEDDAGTQENGDESSEVGETSLEDVSEDQRNECCISQEMALQLGRLSLKIEEYYKSARDIEWGVKDGTVYILQSRPVTTGVVPSEYEIEHEFDGPLRCEEEIFTICNTGEVMPGAMSPMGIDLINKIFPAALRRKNAIPSRNNFSKGKYHPVGTQPFYNHLMMSVIELLTMMDDLESLAAQGLMTGVFGRVLDDPDILRLAKHKDWEPISMSLVPFLKFLRNLFFCGKPMIKTKEKVFGFKFPIEKCQTASETFDVIVHNCSCYNEPTLLLFSCSGASSVWNMYIITTLAKENGCIDNEVYCDFSKLLANQSNVESADVPSAMDDLALQISKDTISETFKSMSIEEAQTWLEQSNSIAGCSYRRFMQRHGHRCLKEFDVYSRTWSMDPKPLIKLVQAMVRSSSGQSGKEIKSVSQRISQLKIPVRWTTKLLLRFIVPNCLRAIREREESKAILIKVMDHLRAACDQLSRQMVSEGYLPDCELMFFLTLDEVGEVLRTRNPRLVSRAVHRRKLHPTLEKLLFEAMSKGRPVPINKKKEDDTEYIADLTMKGTPVSQGVVKAYARVAISIEEAADLQPGEILITYSTDIAWSPYFSILTGVVTELGGLISHGAVVSREYGIPCVVGLTGATRKFKTGDYVLLDGSKGILSRIPAPNS